MAAALRGDPETLPPAARRYLEHAVAPGAPAATGARLRMRGEIRLRGRWHAFSASHWVDPHRGFHWRATVRMGLVPVRGFDRYEAGRGEMRWRLAGLLPMVHATGPDIDRSARGRVVAEAIFSPAALRPEHGVRWWEGEDGWLRAHWPLDGEDGELRLDVDATGRLERLLTVRWGNPDGQGWRAIPFGGRVEGEATFHGLTIPTRISAGWWFGTERYAAEGELFRAVIDDLEPA